jgi:hypothetical protein
MLTGSVVSASSPLGGCTIFSLGSSLMVTFLWGLDFDAHAMQRTHTQQVLEPAPQISNAVSARQRD